MEAIMGTAYILEKRKKENFAKEEEKRATKNESK